MDYESLAGNGNAGNSNFHPAVPMAPSAALHFGPFAPQFSAQVQLDTKVMRVKKRYQLLQPFHTKDLTKLAILYNYRHHQMLCSLAQDSFNERVAKGRLRPS